MLFVGLVCLIGPLVFGRDFDLTPQLLLAVLSGALLIVVFLHFERRIERKGRLPLVDCSLLLDRRFGLGLAAASFFFFGNLSFYLVMTLFLQGTLGYSAWDAGLTVLPLAFAFVVASRRSSTSPVKSPAGVLWSSRSMRMLCTGCAAPMRFRNARAAFGSSAMRYSSDRARLSTAAGITASGAVSPRTFGRR